MRNEKKEVFICCYNNAIFTQTGMPVAMIKVQFYDPLDNNDKNNNTIIYHIYTG